MNITGKSNKVHRRKQVRLFRYVKGQHEEKFSMRQDSQLALGL